MDNRTKPQSAVEKSAQKHFMKAERAGTTAKDTYINQRAAGAVKMAKLRALRLAKEAQDKAEADLQTTPETKPVSAVRRKRAVAVKPAKMIRMSY